jgi:hypothetical protein
MTNKITITPKQREKIIIQLENYIGIAYFLTMIISIISLNFFLFILNILGLGCAWVMISNARK